MTRNRSDIQLEKGQLQKDKKDKKQLQKDKKLVKLSTAQAKRFAAKRIIRSNGVSKCCMTQPLISFVYEPHCLQSCKISSSMIIIYDLISSLGPTGRGCCQGVRIPGESDVIVKKKLITQD